MLKPHHINHKLNNSRQGNLHQPDWILIITGGIIIVYGLVMLSSASSVIAYDKFHDSYHYFKNQLFGLAAGIIFFLFFSKIDYRKWKKYAFLALIVSIFLLLLVFIPGLSAGWGSARSWIKIFGYSLQPSELVKITFLLYLAAWLENRSSKLGDIHQGTGPFIVVLGIISLLMVLQPDMGTLSIIMASSFIVFFAAGGSIKHLIIIFTIGILLLALIVQSNEYQKNRFKCLINPQFDSQKTCYQVNQSLIAIGSGGIFGRGLGESRQKYMYVPEVYGDSIFAVISEETGLIFGIILILLYIFIFYRGYLIAINAPDVFGKLLAIGIVSWISVQALINIGGTTNLMPMTGVPLPLVSYGGSALVAALSALGILVNISKQTR